MPATTKSNLTAEEIRALFDYDPVSGIFIRIADNMHFVFGCLKIRGEGHEVSRYIWLHFYGEWPPLDKLVDHKDRDRTNTKIDNLRLATYSQNGFNLLHNSPHGHKGVTFDCTRNKKWRAQIRFNGQKVNLGRFYTEEEAASAYKQAAIEHHGEFVCLS